MVLRSNEMIFRGSTLEQLFWDIISSGTRCPRGLFWMDLRVAQTKSGEAQLCPLAQSWGEWCFCKCCPSAGLSGRDHSVQIIPINSLGAKVVIFLTPQLPNPFSNWLGSRIMGSQERGAHASESLATSGRGKAPGLCQKPGWGPV